MLEWDIDSEKRNLSGNMVHLVHYLSYGKNVFNIICLKLWTFCCKLCMLLLKFCLPLSFSLSKLIQRFFHQRFDSLAIFCLTFYFVFSLLFTLHKKWGFSLRISSVNLTKSTVFCGFGHIYWKSLMENFIFRAVLLIPHWMYCSVPHSCSLVFLI